MYMYIYLCHYFILPCQLEETWRPVTEGLHVDQNPFSKPGLDCVQVFFVFFTYFSLSSPFNIRFVRGVLQGMLPLYDVTHETGGLEVCPRSHLPEATEAFRARSVVFNCNLPFRRPLPPPPLVFMSIYICTLFRYPTLEQFPTMNFIKLDLPKAGRPGDPLLGTGMINSNLIKIQI